jgi:Ser/Thr protein kinase RdoA (MazF antagonist)
MNDTWLLEWSGRRAVLRRHRHRERSQIEWEYLVLAQARTSGIPCPRVVPTAHDGAYLEEDGWFYTLYSWAPGVQVPRGQIDVGQARSIGSMLGRIHLALSALAGGPEAHDPLPSVESTLDRIDRLIAITRGRPDTGRWGWLVERLCDQARCLRTLGPPTPFPTRPSQVIHGDYLDTNVFFEGSEVSCVIDWDKARREVPAREVVRAMDHGFGMAREQCRSFLQGYRSIISLPTEELTEAADWFAHQQAHSLWVTEQLLVEDNHGVANLIEPTPYVPFSQSWQSAALV